MCVCLSLSLGVYRNDNNQPETRCIQLQMTYQQVGFSLNNRPTTGRTNDGKQCLEKFTKDLLYAGKSRCVNLSVKLQAMDGVNGQPTKTKKPQLTVLQRLTVYERIFCCNMNSQTLARQLFSFVHLFVVSIQSHALQQYFVFLLCCFHHYLFTEFISLWKRKTVN